MFEVLITYNFPKLLTDTKPQVQEAHRTQNTMKDKYEKKLYHRISKSKYDIKTTFLKKKGKNKTKTK